MQEFHLHYARVVGHPAGYRIEPRNAREALTEAPWAEMQGNIAKANAIRKRGAEAVLAKLRELYPRAEVEVR